MKRAIFILTLAILASACLSRTSKNSASTDITTEAQEVTSKPAIVPLTEEELAAAKEMSAAAALAAEKIAEEARKKLSDTTVTVLYPKKARAPKRQFWESHNIYELYSWECQCAFGFDIPLYGKVSSISTKVPEDSDTGMEISFNERGDIDHISYSSEFVSDSTDEHGRAYTYNSKGKVIKQTSWCYNGEVNQPLNAKYDSAGRVLERDLWNSMWHIGRETCKYDSKGNLIEKESPYLGKEIYTYDSHSNLIMRIRLTENHICEDGNCNAIAMTKIKREKWTYKYDKNDNLIIRIEYNEEDIVVSKKIYHYDNKGNIVKIVDVDINGDECETSGFKYDSKGNMIEDNKGRKYYITYYK